MRIQVTYFNLWLFLCQGQKKTRKITKQLKKNHVDLTDLVPEWITLMRPLKSEHLRIRKALKWLEKHLFDGVSSKNKMNKVSYPMFSK